MTPIIPNGNAHQKPSVLLVSESASFNELAIDFDLVTLQFQFVSGDSPNGLSTWLGESESEKHIYINVMEECRSLVGGYSQQALNHHVGRAMFHHQIQVVVVNGLVGCTADLARIVSILKVPVILVLEQATNTIFDQLDDITSTWLHDIFKSTDIFVCEQALQADWQLILPRDSVVISPEMLSDQIHDLVSLSPVSSQFDYSLYEFCGRDPSQLVREQKVDIRHFEGCHQVLDLACGIGIFLEQLRFSGINAVGVERNSIIAEYGRGMGLDIITDDALQFLESTALDFDGIYCSHFVEHLPFELVQKTISLLANRLEKGGVLVLAFPDPESIRSQLLGFWRDPEHVRFYHPELIISIAQSMGFVCEWSSYDEQPHHVVPFEESPPEVELLPDSSIMSEQLTQPIKYSLWQYIIEFFGFVSARRYEMLQDNLFSLREDIGKLEEKQKKIRDQLVVRTDKLWEINKTWAWNDNVVLRLRKR